MPPSTQHQPQSQGIFAVLNKLYDDYKSSTPKKLKLIDAYLFCILLTGIFQFAYCCLVGTFPFNAFLSGFISTVASFVLAGKSIHSHSHTFIQIKSILFNIASYRIQLNKANQDVFNNVSGERAFADFIFAHVILHLIVINFIG